jgi:periplasmic protein TonB
MNRRLFIVLAVTGVHALGLWGLYIGPHDRPPQELAPLLVRAELIDAPSAQPALASPSPSPTPPPSPSTPPSAAQQQRALSPVQQRQAVAPDNAPSPSTLAATPPPAPPTHAEPPSAAPASRTPQAAQESAAPVATAAAPLGAPLPPARIELPSTNADYLNNPRPPYPPLSKRLGEQGKVVVRVLIDASGTATQAEIRSSSGYERLDQTALQTVLRWRYVPGKRNGMAEAMWFNVPIQFVLE